MKYAIKYSIIVFVLVFSAMVTVCNAESEDGTNAEPEKVTVDIEKLGKELGVKEVEVQRPDGNSRISQQWGKADIQKAMAENLKRYSDPGKTYLVDASPSPVITLAFIQALQPMNVLYLYAGAEMPMCELKKVDKIPGADSNYGVRFEIVEEGDKVFMNFNSDEPGASQHTFATDDTCKLTIPEIPKGKHLFLHARGKYCTMVALAFNYVKDSKSVSIASHEEDYTCAVSFSDDIEVGDVTTRTLPNDL